MLCHVLWPVARHVCFGIFLIVSMLAVFCLSVRILGGTGWAFAPPLIFYALVCTAAACAKRPVA